MPLDRWEHQWLRAWRWHARTLTASGRDTGKGSLDAEDFAEVLAQSVWHLKDWLKNDDRQQAVAEQVEEFARSTPVLLVLADLCNGSKHSVLTARRRAEDTKFGHLTWVGDGDPDDPESIERVYVTVTSPDWDRPREVVDVAREGLEAWADLLVVMAWRRRSPDRPSRLFEVCGR